MSKEEELQRQLDDYRKAKTAVLDRLDECLTLPDNRKKAMFDNVAPVLKSAWEAKVERNAEFNLRDLQTIVYEKAMAALLGDDWKKNVEAIQ